MTDDATKKKERIRKVKMNLNVNYLINYISKNKKMLKSFSVLSRAQTDPTSTFENRRPQPASPPPTYEEVMKEVKL